MNKKAQQIMKGKVARRRLIRAMLTFGYLEPTRESGQYLDFDGRLVDDANIGLPEIRDFFEGLDAAQKYDFEKDYQTFFKGVK